MAEWRRSGLQIRVHEFDSRSRLQILRLSAHVLGLFLFAAVYSSGNGGSGHSPVSSACTGLSLYVDSVTNDLVETTLSN